VGILTADRRALVLDAGTGVTVGSGRPVDAIAALDGGLAVLGGGSVQIVDRTGVIAAAVPLRRWHPGPYDEVALRAGSVALWALARTPEGEVTAVRLGRAWRT